MNPEQRQLTIQRLRELLATVRARDPFDTSHIGLFGEELRIRLATIYPPETDEFKRLSAPLGEFASIGALEPGRAAAFVVVRDSFSSVVEWEMERLQPGSSGPPGVDPNLMHGSGSQILASAGNAESALGADGTLTLVPARWTEERAEMLRRLNGIDEVLRQIKPIVENLGAVEREREGIGGNNPPDPIEDAPIDAEYLNVTLAADSTLRIQLSAEQPSSWETVRLVALVLKRARRGLAALAEYLLRKGDTFLDSAVRAAGVAAVGMLATAVAVHNSLNQLTITLGDLVAWLERVFAAINLPL